MSDRKPPHLTVLAALPFTVMVVVAAVDINAGPGVGYLPLVSLGPAFAGLVGGWRRTAFIGAAALLLCTALGIYNESYSQRRLYTAMASVAGVTAAGVAAAVMRQRREAELASVRSIAEGAQRVLLRPVPRSAGPLRIASSYTSAVADARIGGDLYEVVASPHGVRIVLGDVQGKGLEAVETAALVLGAFREAAHEELDLTSVGVRVERVVNRELQGEKFVTAIFAEVADRHTMTLLNYGHPAPMVVRPDGTTCFAEPPRYAPPLGLGLHDVVGPDPYEADFVPGDQVLLYTDGVSETRDHTGAFYPLGDHSFLLKDVDPAAALNAIRTELVRHAQGPLHDDAAMLLLRYQEY